MLSKDSLILFLSKVEQIVALDTLSAIPRLANIARATDRQIITLYVISWEISPVIFCDPTPQILANNENVFMCSCLSHKLH